MSPTLFFLFRAAERTGVELTLVANRWLKVPPARNIRAIQVEPGFDVADNEIVRRVTADIPLAAEVVAKDAVALNPRGERYIAENIRERLNMRDFMDTLRASGIDTGGQSALGTRDRQAFANQLDQLLAQARPATRRD
ncbi:YaiI/YqxD family protein [Oleiagrimonas citrea]|uniref:DUF188 domain-containing protein n=1 Tax=Oleiagrimonas citrea TaxID=1665687 RepID=A0A846ZJU6_9GAMM|nr:DUF188 domain-containing protein [Oleiagrimonas citrea]NKZ37828.1 DUF188 domain-containing protein [Oleiagrimonas citrea]